MGLRTWLGLKKPKTDYWEARKDSLYLKEAAALVRARGATAKSIVDVGSNGCAYLDWFDWIPTRVSIDLRNPHRSQGTLGVRTDFFRWQPRERFDICLCLQVIEHIPDARGFARKLLQTAPLVIVSVPYKWRPVASNRHVHDPVDEAKVDSWFDKPADERIIVAEREGRSRRMICVYVDRSHGPPSESHPFPKRPRTWMGLLRC